MSLSNSFSLLMLIPLLTSVFACYWLNIGLLSLPASCLLFPYVEKPHPLVFSYQWIVILLLAVCCSRLLIHTRSVLLEYVGLFASISEGGLPDQEVNVLLILFLFSVFSLFLFFDTVSHPVDQAASKSHTTCPSRRLDSRRISSFVFHF